MNDAYSYILKISKSDFSGPIALIFQGNYYRFCEQEAKGLAGLYLGERNE